MKCQRVILINLALNPGALSIYGLGVALMQAGRLRAWSSQRSLPTRSPSEPALW
jgi:hypothetical protein